MRDRFSWAEGSRLVNEVGSERWLGQRVQMERKARGWSQTDLSRELAKLGHPMHQSAISKIEPEDMTRVGGRPRRDTSLRRRNVTIDEAVGFSKVFGIPLGELLLPPDAVRHREAWQQYLDAAETLGRLRGATFDYALELSRLRSALRQYPDFAERLLEERRDAVAAAQAELQAVLGDGWDESQLGRDYPFSVAIQVIDDALKPEESE